MRLALLLIVAVSVVPRDYHVGATSCNDNLRMLSRRIQCPDSAVTNAGIRFAMMTRFAARPAHVAVPREPIADSPGPGTVAVAMQRSRRNLKTPDATDTPNKAVTDVPIPELALWESQMQRFGKLHRQRLLDGTYKVDETYYDAQRVYQQIASYTDDRSWLKAADRAQEIYLAESVIRSNAKIPAYWVFTHGLTENFLRTGDAQAKQWAIALARNAAYAPDVTPLAWTKGADRSREVAYILMSYINAERLGEPRSKRLSPLLEQALGHLDQQFVDETYRDVKPFMFSLTAEALIFYWDHVGKDPRIVEKLKAGADWIWDNAWLPDAAAFYYEAKNSAKAAPDLNLLIAPVYAWLYLQTGDITYRDRGDAIFAGGVRKAYLEGSKQFNQNYRWSFDYLKWRNAVPNTP